MPRLLAVGRHREILRQVETAGMASVEALATELAVSRETIRRDLKLLAARGVLAVVHGGAVRRDGTEASFAARRAENREGKERIAACAVRLIRPGMSMLLDSGTTTLALAAALAASAPSRVVVHTTSLAAARLLGSASGMRVHLLGGEFDPNDEATRGPPVQAALATLRTDLAFVGVGGVAPDGCITDYARTAAEQRNAMLRAAGRSYLLADRLKFGRELQARVDTRDAAALLADEFPPPSLAAALKRQGLPIITPRNND